MRHIHLHRRHAQLSKLNTCNIIPYHIVSYHNFPPRCRHSISRTGSRNNKIKKSSEFMLALIGSLISVVVWLMAIMATHLSLCCSSSCSFSARCWLSFLRVWHSSIREWHLFFSWPSSPVQSQHRDRKCAFSNVWRGWKQGCKSFTFNHLAELIVKKKKKIVQYRTIQYGVVWHGVDSTVST